MLEWNVHGGLRGDGDGDGLKKYGKFIQQVKRMAAVVRELQRASECLRAASVLPCRNRDLQWWFASGAKNFFTPNKDLLLDSMN